MSQTTSPVSKCLLCYLLIGCLVVTCLRTSSADDLPEGVVNTQKPTDKSLSPQESLERITVPEGFQVTLFAGEPDLRRPIAFDFDDRGRLWVVENYSHPNWREDNATDRVLILEDVDQDGRFDRRKVFWDKGRYLSGIVVGHGGVWLANTPELVFLPDRDGDDIPDAEPIVILDGFAKSNNNVLNNFHWGPDGWLYGAIGLSKPSLIGAPGTPENERTRITRGMWRFHPVSHKFERLADGMVNPWGADFNEYGDLFTANTVIAHLWHIVPGMYCARRAGEHGNRFAYEQIQSITNHLHWGGGTWQSSRSGHQHSVTGGGHAHCGGMVYLGDNWPKKYRGTFFTNNLHGNRVNNDRLVPKNSSYVGEHADDFLFANDPWFRGLSIKYGPDGGVYISDWHDLGECHDNDGSHRSSGRIYKVVYGKPNVRKVDLQRSSDVELAEFHTHANEWLTRHARRVLHERVIAGCDIEDARKHLREIFAGKNELNRLRAMWTLFVIGDFDSTKLVELLNDKSEHVRRWAIRLLVDQEQPKAEAVAVMRRLARNDTSPKVRLSLASALQRIPAEQRWPIAEALMSHAKDSRDDYIPLMIWYGIEPLISTDAEQSLEMAVHAKIPQLRRFIARRVLDVEQPPIEKVVQVASILSDETVQLDLLQGMLDALDERGNQTVPASWQAVYAKASSSSNATLRSVAVRLATIFGDKSAIARLRDTVSNKEASDEDRREALRSLLKLDEGVPISLLHELVTEPSVLRRDAIQALGLRNNKSTSAVLLETYTDLDESERRDAISVLATRRTFAAALLGAIEQKRVDQRDVSAFALQQLRAFSDEGLKKRISVLWANDSKTLQKSDEIAQYKAKMNPDYLNSGDVHVGRLVFERTCMKCHTLFGEGGTIGPDLTGSGRMKADYVLTNLIDPSATIDPKYRLTQVLTLDGRLLSGFLVHQDDRFLVLRTQDARIRMEMKEVEELMTSRVSMMPEGMLRTFRDEEVRDLLLYLASPQQVPRPEDDHKH